MTSHKKRIVKGQKQTPTIGTMMYSGDIANITTSINS